MIDDKKWGARNKYIKNYGVAGKNTIKIGDIDCAFFVFRGMRWVHCGILDDTYCLNRHTSKKRCAFHCATANFPS